MFYLILNLIIISFPLLNVFDKRFEYFKKMKYYLASIFAVSTIYLIWDYFATVNFHWAFSKINTIGINLFYLPIEEIMFFVTVSFSCLFLWEAINYYFEEKKFELNRTVYYGIIGIVLILLFVFALLNISRGYTFIVSLALASTIAIVFFFERDFLLKKNYYIYFALTGGLFVIFNFLLTSYVVSYNPEAILNFRILTIPVEDFLYNIAMLLAYLFVYEKAKKILKN